MERFWRRFIYLLRRERFNRDLEDEMQFHLAMKAQASGHAAQRRFGNAVLLREQSREQWGWGWLDRFAQDLRYGVRMLWHNPSFTLIAVLTLAVGIGVNTAIFTAFNAVALRPLDVPEAERIVYLERTTQAGLFPYPDYAYLRQNSHVFSALTAAIPYVFSMSGVPSFNSAQQSGLAGAAGFSFPEPLTGRNAEPLVGMLVEGNYLRVLGIQPAMGRDFIPGEDDKPGAHPVLLISDNFWERRFARDPGILGRTVVMNDVAFTVVGITPRDFTGTAPLVPCVWAPIAMRDRLEPGSDLLHDRSVVCCRLYGRLAPDADAQRAQVETDGLYQRLKATYPDRNAREQQVADSVVVKPASAFPNPEDLRMPAMFVLGAVSLVLLIACANVASLMLARSAARQKEIAVRLAIGASRGRLIRQLMTESALISMLAGAAGLMLAWWVLHLLMLKIADSIPMVWVTLALHLAPDERVFAYMLVLSMAAAIGFGLVPALQASKPNLTSALKEESGGLGRLSKTGLRDMLVGVQVAVCLLLLINAGLLARGSQRAFGIDLGFDYRNMIGIEFRSMRTSQLPEQLRATRRQVLARIEGIAGVRSVAAASRMPLTGGTRSVLVALDGRPIDAQHALDALYTAVSPGYFETLGVPILRGRDFTERDARDSDDFNGAPVIISERTARKFWPGQDAIGRTIRFEPPPDDFAFPGERHPHSTSSVVIGIARDIRSAALQEFDDTALYFSVTRQFPDGILVRTAGDPRAVSAALHRELPAIDPKMEAFVFDFRSGFSGQPVFVMSRLGAVGSAIIGILGLVMASVGIYGMVSFAVSQRTHEVGIRMALGARREDVLRLVLRQSMRPVLIGMAAGVMIASGVARLLVSMLFGLSTFDPLTFLGVSAILAAVAFVAGYIPARRATRVDPMVALRYE